jgi:hypothetical protein
MKKALTWILVASIISGCAVSKGSFYQNRYAVSDTALCRTFIGGTGSDYQFSKDVQAEVARRNLNYQSCQAKVKESNNLIGAAVVGAVVVGAAVAASKRGGGGGGGGGNSYAESGADWDAFYNQYGQLVWACRDIQTGRFTEAYNCAGKSQTDSRWPSK